MILDIVDIQGRGQGKKRKINKNTNIDDLGLIHFKKKKGTKEKINKKKEEGLVHTKKIDQKEKNRMKE